MDSTLRRYWDIASTNLRYNLLPHVGLAVLILLVTPIIFGAANLDAQATATPLELFVSLIGIVLLTPVFTPEQNGDILETVESKYTSHTGVCFVRMLMSISIMAILISMFTLIMSVNGCQVSPLHIAGTFSSALFLGSLGFIAHGISGNAAVGYMLPVMYYVFNLTVGKDSLNQFYLFSMMQGSYQEKTWLLFGAVIVILFTLLFHLLRRKLR